MRWKALLRRRMSVAVSAKFDGEPCTLTVTYSLGGGLTFKIDMDDGYEDSVLKVSKSAIQDARDQLGV